MTKGKFIVLEGPDACGKGSVAEFIRTNFDNFKHTREIGGTPYAEGIRQIMLDTKHTGVLVISELLACYAARIDHCQEIKRILDSGVNVICERFYWSTFAYQGDSPELMAVHNLSAPYMLEPDLTIYLNVSTDVSQHRMFKVRQAQGIALDKIELRPREYHERVRDRYNALCQSQKNVEIVDAEQPLETVKSSVRQVINRLLGVTHENFGDGECIEELCSDEAR